MAFTAISVQYGYAITIPQVLMVTLPASVIGLLAASACSYRRGKDLDADPAFQERMNDPETRAYMFGSESTVLDREIPVSARRAVGIFFAAIVLIVVFAMFQNMLPTYTQVVPVGGATGDFHGITPDQLAQMGIVLSVSRQMKPTKAG